MRARLVAPPAVKGLLPVVGIHIQTSSLWRPMGRGAVVPIYMEAPPSRDRASCLIFDPKSLENSAKLRKTGEYIRQLLVEKRRYLNNLASFGKWIHNP